MSGTQEYRAWKAMQERCYKPGHISYRWYGARGVTVADCFRGPGGFEAFIAEVGMKPDPAMVLDRIDTNRPYEPGNVRWVTASVSSKNRRRFRQPGKTLTIDGVTKRVDEWAKMPAALSSRAIRYRLQQGWAPRDAVFAPRDPGSHGKGGARVNPPRDERGTFMGAYRRR